MHKVCYDAFLRYECGRKIVSEILVFLKEKYHFFSHFGLDKRIIFDPGFSFSKNPDQTRKLIAEFPYLVEEMKKENLNCPILAGISTKTCLRSPIGEKNHNPVDDHLEYERAEYFHYYWLVSWMSRINYEYPIYFRVHQMQKLEWAYDFFQFFKR